MWRGVCLNSFFGAALVAILLPNAVYSAATLINSWSFSNNLNDNVGSATLLSVSQPQRWIYTSDRYCNPSSAVYFSQDYLKVPPGVYFDGGDFSFNTWIWMNSLKPWQRIFDFGNNMEDRKENVILAFYEATFRINAELNTAWPKLTSDDNLFKLKQWKMITFVLSGSKGYIYLDGKLVKTDTVTLPQNIIRNNNYFGKSKFAHDGYLDAILDEIELYSGALSASEILTKYQEASQVPPMSCGGWGDPHYHSFDGATFNFQGRCIYDLVSTSCTGKTLPTGLTPFSIQVKHTDHYGLTAVSFIKYVQLSAFDNVYRLETTGDVQPVTASTLLFTVNGVQKNTPFNDFTNGISVQIVGGSLQLTTQFGLVSLTFGDASSAQLALDTKYAQYVCGLCGNGDGNAANDFSDRSNNLVQLVGDDNTKYFRWGSNWKAAASFYPPNDKSLDIDKSICVAPTCTSNCPAIPSTVCTKKDTYKTSNDWCGKLKDPASPWSACLVESRIKQDQIQGLIDSCTFDLCASEDNPTLQAQFKCAAYANIAQWCSSITQSTIPWRSATNCPLTCPANMVYKDLNIPACPATCLIPNANPNCNAATLPVPGCYCNDGLVLDPAGNCIQPSSCGCPLPDNSAFISVGQRVIGSDCKSAYTCTASRATATPVALNENEQNICFPTTTTSTTTTIPSTTTPAPTTTTESPICINCQSQIQQFLQTVQTAYQTLLNGCKSLFIGSTSSSKTK